MQLTNLYKNGYIDIYNPDTLNKHMPELIKLKLLSNSNLEGSLKKRMIRYLGIDSIKDTAHEYIINDFITKNSTIYQIDQTPFEDNKNCAIISGSEIATLLTEDLANSDWSNYYQRYSNSSGILSLSRVGLNEKKTQAIVYIEKHCGFHCETGSYLFLGNSKNGWKVNSIYRIWEL